MRKKAPVTASRLTTVLGIVAAIALWTAASASAFEIVEFSGGPVDADGNLVTQAGAHPDLVTNLQFSGGKNGPDINFKNIEVDFPRGMVIDPSATPTCKQTDLRGPQGNTTCSPAAQVGILKLTVNYFGFVSLATVPIYNIDPPSGVPGRFGSNISSVIVNFDSKVRSGGDYGITALIKNNSQSLPVQGTEVTLWGVPADPRHDTERLCNGQPEGASCPTREPRRPLISNPSDCGAGSLAFTTRVDSWQDPSEVRTASFSTGSQGEPIKVTGCEKVHFSPKLTAQPQNQQADSPTALDVSLTIPQSDDPDGYATALLNRATVTFPEGMAVNPASATGLGSCTLAQIDLSSDSPPSCPASSTLASVTLDTPLLKEPLTGNVFLAKQGENPFGSTLAIYLVAEGSGVTIKVPGKISPDPQTGRLETTFDDNPPLPFEQLDLQFKGGPRAALTTPPACGTYVSTGEFVPWSALDKDNPNADELRVSTDSFQITSGPGGGPCPAGRFEPTMEAGTLDPFAGSYSPFVLRLHRDDGTERFRNLSVELPKGLIGKLAGLSYCPDATLAGISPASGTGGSELLAPSCPASSRVGSVKVAAGTGSNPVRVDTGAAYLAGPYKGAPLSLAIVAPAVTGPFDLGTVVVRNALRVDPSTAELTAISDPIPTILEGIPLDIRDIRIDVDRPGFTLNPTGCDPTEVRGSVTATSSAVAQLSNPFQAVACGELGFKPKLALKFSGPTHRSAHPALRATLTMPKDHANIGKAVVTLPPTEFLENAHIRTICTRVQYAADNCPKGSIYGYAKAWTPLLDKPLQGPVYLRSSNHTLPDLVASLDGQIHVDLAGRIDSPGGRIRNTFWAVPDAPVSKFVLTMQGGKKGLLVNNEELCKAKPRAQARFTGQNGKVLASQPLVKTDCGGKKRR